MAREFWFLIPSSLLCFPWVRPSFQNILCSSWILFFEFLRWEVQSHWLRKALIATKLAHQELKKAPLTPQYFYNKKYENIPKFQFRIIKSGYKTFENLLLPTNIFSLLLFTFQYWSQVVWLYGNCSFWSVVWYLFLPDICEPGRWSVKIIFTFCWNQRILQVTNTNHLSNAYMPVSNALWLRVFMRLLSYFSV